MLYFLLRSERLSTSVGLPLNVFLAQKGFSSLTGTMSFPPAPATWNPNMYPDAAYSGHGYRTDYAYPPVPTLPNAMGGFEYGGFPPVTSVSMHPPPDMRLGHLPPPPDVRHGHTPQHRDPKASLREALSNMNAEEVAKIMVESKRACWMEVLLSTCLNSISPDSFRKVWPTTPQTLKAVVWEPPPDVNVNFREILDDNARKKTCIALNSLRRERCLPLVPHADRHFWGEESWVLSTRTDVTALKRSLVGPLALPSNCYK